MPADVILLGGPGAGKGTQAQRLQKRFGYVQISTGDLLRAHRANGTELGKEAESYMRRGDLVPDTLIIAMVENELPAVGAALFDGFPRNVAQAQALDALLEARGRGLPRAIYFDVDRATLEQRLLGRWTNPRTGRVYHERFNPPKAAGIDDEDGGPLIQREDDKPGTIETRLNVFEAQTLPLIEYYGASRRLVRITATMDVDAVTQDVLAALDLEERQTAP